MSQDDAQRLIDAVNHQELMRRRQVHGRDLNDWHTALRELKAAGETRQALVLLHEIIDKTLALAQYDAREPQLWWFTQAAWLHERHRDYDKAAAVLQQWLDAWPDRRAIPWRSRPAIDRERTKVHARIQRLRRRAGVL
ncbi:hypothetical protein [Nesterenkonia flava]|uniref:Tetratricopeptide repeat protein n=1 Tax=Nesterenkonia flava TaxID=469799 RepID=A0ABU1FWW5_9MICC|nr:hypothetical protein [Nesterenkonia flava]MDR5712965.1 hypothetical protein [Nesterenkonia flava]